MCDFDTFKPIPNYIGYSINKYGIIKDIKTGSIINQAIGKNGYYVCFLTKEFDTSDGLKKRSVQLLTHRLMATTWIDNPDNLPTVNHKDGNKLNNHVSNLEWMSISDNNKHAVEVGLRDPVHKFTCRLRDFHTGEIKEFDSVMEAVRYMGFTGPVSKSALSPKLFGKLIKNRWEVRWCGDSRPWFYETRKDRVLSRYMVIVEFPDNTVKEFFDNKSIIKYFRLYGLGRKSIKEMVKHLISSYPEYKITFTDALDVVVNSKVKKPRRINENKSIIIGNDDHIVIFDSVRAAANYLKVDKSIITKAADKMNLVMGYVVMQNELELIEIYRLRSV